MASFSVLFLAILLPFGASAAETENLAIEVDLRGGIVGFDQAAYATVRAIMGSLVANGTVEHFVTTSRGLEGGGRFCLQLAPQASPRKALVLAQLQGLKVDLDTTAYSVRELDRCEIPATSTDGTRTLVRFVL